jgi:hypothetical protein
VALSKANGMGYHIIDGYWGRQVYCDDKYTTESVDMVIATCCYFVFCECDSFVPTYEVVGIAIF